MKQFFEDLFKPDENGVTNAYGDNPSTLSLAGLMAATSGRRLGDVMTEAAAVNRDRETQKLNKMKQEQVATQLIGQQKFGQWLLQNPQANSQEVVQKGSEYGLPFENIAAVANLFKTEEKVLEDRIYGTPPQVVSKKGGVIQGTRPLMPGGNGEMPVYSNPSGNDFNNEMSGALGIPNNAPTPKQEIPKGRASAETFLNSPEYAPNIPKETIRERELNKKHYQSFQKDTLQPAFQAIQDSKQGLGLIKEASKKFKTGTAGDQRLEIQKLANYFGIKNGESLSSGELLRIASNNLALNVGQKMKGQFSDKDRDFVVNTVPSLNTSPEGIEKMIEYYEKINQRMKEYSEAAEGYYQKYRTLEGFESAFSKYANAHNVFEENSKSSNHDKYKNVSTEDIRRALEKKRRG